MSQPKKPTMTSQEAAALLLSGGKTSDVEEANLMDQGKLLDPDALERAYYRRALGFDVDIEYSQAAHKAYVRDLEFGLVVTCPYEDDINGNAQYLARAVMKLKRMHDKQAKRSETAEA